MHKNMKQKKVLLSLVVLLVLLTGCIPTRNALPNVQPAGFFTGLWHGWIAPISLISSFFNPGSSIYQTYNTGFAYDFGFYIAIISGFGSIALKRRRK